MLQVGLIVGSTRLNRLAEQRTVIQLHGVGLLSPQCLWEQSAWIS
jgi:hypothetical protein